MKHIKLFEQFINEKIKINPGTIISGTISYSRQSVPPSGYIVVSTDNGDIEVRFNAGNSEGDLGINGKSAKDVIKGFEGKSFEVKINNILGKTRIGFDENNFLTDQKSIDSLKIDGKSVKFSDLSGKGDVVMYVANYSKK